MTNNNYKCLLPLSLFYMTIKLITVLLIYKIVQIGSITTTAATLVIPLWFLTGDIVAECYGYEISKQLILYAIIFQFVFALICYFLIKLPSSNNWPYQGAYNHILGNLPRIAFASFIAIFIGGRINAFFISKWKVLLHGRFFWLRSLGASIVGEGIFTILAISIEFFGVVPFKSLSVLMMTSFLVKLIVNPLLVIPSSIVSSIIKKIEKIDVYDYDLEFTPFKFKSKPTAINDSDLNKT